MFLLFPSKFETLALSLEVFKFFGVIPRCVGPATEIALKVPSCDLDGRLEAREFLKSSLSWLFLSSPSLDDFESYLSYFVV